MQSYPQLVDMRGASIRGRFGAPPRIGQSALPNEIAPAIQRSPYASALNGFGFNVDLLPPASTWIDAALARVKEAATPTSTPTPSSKVGSFTAKEQAAINAATDALQAGDSALTKKLLSTLDATVIPKLHEQAVVTGSGMWMGLEKLAREALLGEASVQGGTTIEQKTAVVPRMKTGTKLAIAGGVGLLGLGVVLLFLRRRR